MQPQIEIFHNRTIRDGLLWIEMFLCICTWWMLHQSESPIFRFSTQLQTQKTFVLICQGFLEYRLMNFCHVNIISPSFVVVIIVATDSWGKYLGCTICIFGHLFQNGKKSLGIGLLRYFRDIFMEDHLKVHMSFSLIALKVHLEDCLHRSTLLSGNRPR